MRRPTLFSISVMGKARRSRVPSRSPPSSSVTPGTWRAWTRPPAPWAVAPSRVGSFSASTRCGARHDPSAPVSRMKSYGPEPLTFTSTNAVFPVSWTGSRPAGARRTVAEIAARRLMPTLYASRPMKSLRRLEKLHREYGNGRAGEKAALLLELERVRLPSARAVLRLHEILLFLRAFPDDAEVLEAVNRTLSGFSRRRDLARFRGGLAGTGIAGTEIRYRFFWPMARWLASRWPERLQYADDAVPEFDPRLRAALPVLVPPLASEAIRRSERPTTEILDR